jgi:hypothetical protein
MQLADVMASILVMTTLFLKLYSVVINIKASNAYFLAGLEDYKSGYYANAFINFGLSGLHASLALMEATMPVPPTVGGAFATVRSGGGTAVLSSAASNIVIRDWVVRGSIAAANGAVGTAGLLYLENRQFGPGANAPAGSNSGASGKFRIDSERLSDLAAKVNSKHSFFNVSIDDIMDCLVNGCTGKTGVWGIGRDKIGGFQYTGTLRGRAATIILRADGYVATIYYK